MADYRIVDTKWLANEADKVEGVLLQNTNRGQVYSQAELKSVVLSSGLQYTDQELVDIRDELILRGVLELIV